MSLPRPDDQTLRDWLHMIDARIQGVTRLDQQLVYVPLAATAAAVYAVAANRSTFQSINMGSWVEPAYWFVVIFTLGGLSRNHWRHWQLERERYATAILLGIIPQTGSRVGRRLRRVEWAFALGRPIYFLLFLVGFSAACAALGRLLQ